jgi:hypothetical protein
MPEDIFLCPNIIFSNYDGHIIFLDALVARISASSLQGVGILFSDILLSPIVYIPCIINEIEVFTFANGLSRVVFVPLFAAPLRKR